MKNIAFVLTSLKSGGLEKNASLLANEFAKDNNVFIYCLYSKECFFELSKNIKVIDLSTNKSKFLSLNDWKKSLRSNLVKENINTVVSFGNRCAFVVSKAIKGLNINHICRGINTKKISLIDHIINKSNFPYINKYVFQTEAQKNSYKQKFQSKSVLINNPFELYDKNLNKDGIKSKRFCLVATFKFKQKRHDFILKAFKMFSEHNKEYSLDIYGRYTNKQYKKLKNLIEKLDLEKNVNILGETHNILEAITPSRAFLCASRYEGMPNALIEALSYGVPVITTCWNGVNEIITNGENGIITSMDNIDEYCKAIESISKNDKLFNSLSENAYSGKIRDFGKKDVFLKWREII